MEAIESHYLTTKNKNQMEAVLLYLAHIFTLNKFKVLCSFLVYILAAWVGGFDLVFIAAFSLAFTDYALWFLWGWKNNKLDKQKMKDGVWKFPLYYIAVFSGYKLDEMLPGFMQGVWPVHNFIVVYIGLMEFLSVSKWLMRFNVPLPRKLIEKLENYRDDMNGCRRKEDHCPPEAILEAIPVTEEK